MSIYTHIDKSHLKTTGTSKVVTNMSSFIANTINYANGTTEALENAPAHFVRNVLFALPLSSHNRAVQERSL